MQSPASCCLPAHSVAFAPTLAEVPLGPPTCNLSSAPSSRGAGSSSSDVLMRTLLEPFRLLLKEKFKTGSWPWELRQRARLAKNLLRGISAVHGRDYRGLLAACNTRELEAMDRVKKFYAGPEVWDVLMKPEPAAMTVSSRAKGFKVASRGGSSLLQHLIHRHKQYPFTTLRMYREADLVPQVVRDAKKPDLPLRLR